MVVVRIIRTVERRIVNNGSRYLTTVSIQLPTCMHDDVLQCNRRSLKWLIFPLKTSIILSVFDEERKMKNAE